MRQPSCAALAVDDSRALDDSKSLDHAGSPAPESIAAVLAAHRNFYFMPGASRAPARSEYAKHLGPDGDGGQEQGE